jgi:hypothetical protein
VNTGVFPFIVLVGLGGLVAVAGVAVVLIVGSLLRKSREAGYPSLTAYLRAAPQTDEEKRDAADLALKGLVLCVLGLLFPPVLLFGLVPFFYGTRKVLYASMGLGLADDPNLPDR